MAEGPKGVRRVVTGHDDKAQSVVVIDDVIESEPARGGVAFFAKPWTSATSPADNDDPTDGATRETGLTIEGGTVLRYVDFPPGHRSPMHRTSSLDYGIVLEGAVELELDGGRRVALKPHDLVVQRGTIHAWINPGPGWARMVFAMIDAKPATAGGETLMPEHRA